MGLDKQAVGSFIVCQQPCFRHHDGYSQSTSSTVLTLITRCLAVPAGYAAHQEGAQQEVTPQGELEGAQQLLNMPTQQPQTMPAQQPLTVTPEQPQAVAPQQPQTVTHQQPQTVPAQQPQP